MPSFTYSFVKSRLRVFLSACALHVTLYSAKLAAQQSPWEAAAERLQVSFSGPLARSLAIVAVVVGGVMWMFGESYGKRTVAGLLFGGGLALGAANFVKWLFPQ